MVNSRAKGIRGELRVAKLYRAVYPQARRNYQGRGQKIDGPDIAGVPGWLNVEVKNYRRIQWALLCRWLAARSDPGLSVLHATAGRKSLLVLDEPSWIRIVKWLRDTGYPGEEAS